MLKSIFLKIILFPLDLIYLTVDSCIIGFRSIKRVLKREKDQPCHFCHGDDHSESPHPVRSVLKYQNEWMVKLLEPSIRFRRKDGRRFAICLQEGGFTRPPVRAPLTAVVMVCFWTFGVFGVLKTMSSDPTRFWGNFVAFFNPAGVEQGNEDPDFLELGESRLNPERAERYFHSGTKYLSQQKFPEAQVDFKNAIQSNPTDANLHYHLAKAYLGTGMGVRAESSLRRAVDLDPNHVEALLLLAELMQRQSNQGEALEYASRALELEPENLDAIRATAGLLAARGQKEDVRPLLNKLLAMDGENPDTLTFAGRLEMLLYRDAETARDLLTQALEINPDHVGAMLNMIRIYATDEDVDKIESTLERVLELQPDNIAALRLKADLEMSRYGLPVGVRAYQNLLNRFAGNFELRLRYAELLLMSGNVTEGKRLATELTASRQPEVERRAHWMLAQMYGQIRMYDEAINHARSALRLAPGERGIQVFLAQQLMRMDEPTQARRIIESALSARPDDLGLITMLSQALVQMDQRGQAIQLLDQKLAENPELDPLRMRKVEIQMQSKDWRDALADSRMLYEKYPDNAALKNNLAFLLARSGQELDRAEELVSELRGKFDENPVILDTYGYVLAAQGRHEEAVSVYEQALGKASGNVTIRYHYARSLAALGRAQDAIRELTTVLMINPSFPQAREARALREQLSTGA